MPVVDLGTGTRQRLHGVWQESLARTGHLLVANSVLPAGAGVLYWLLRGLLGVDIHAELLERRNAAWGVLDGAAIFALLLILIGLIA